MQLMSKEYQVGDTRIIASKAEIFKKAATLNSALEGVRMLSMLVGQPIEEAYAVAKYDPRSKRPIEYHWVPMMPWYGELSYKLISQPNGDNVLLETLKQVVPRGQHRVFILSINQAAIVTHRPWRTVFEEKWSNNFIITMSPIIS